MTLVSEAKMKASRMHRPPVTTAVTVQLESEPKRTIGTPARTAIPKAPPNVPPMKAAVLKNNALTTLTSRTNPDDWRVKRVLTPVTPIPIRLLC